MFDLLVAVSLHVLSSAFVSVPNTPAIIIRHDRPDQRYLDLGARFPAVGRVGRRMGDGTLIGDRWVVTAGHVANGLMRRSDDHSVWFGERSYKVAKAYISPKWEEFGEHDIAVLELEEPVTGIKPLGLYRAFDERHRVATLVGHGRTGVGNSRERREDDQKRGATNRVEEATASQLVFRFDAPPSGTDLEGIPGAGDSGGPALIMVHGVARVAGVSSAGQPGTDGPGSYGALDYFTRVSTHAAWLDKVVAGKVRATDFGGAPVSNTDHSGRVRVGAALPAASGGQLPDTPAGRRMRALSSLMIGGDSLAIEGFFRENVAESALGGQSLPDRLASYRRMMDKYRGGERVRVLLAEQYHVDVLIRTASGDLILGVQVAPTAPHRIVGVLEGRM